MFRPIPRILMLCAALAAVSCSQQQTPDTAESSASAKDTDKPSETAAKKATPEEILRRLSETYQAAKTIQVDCEMVIRVEAQGVENRMTQTTRIAAQKPNRLAMRSEDSMIPINFVSDGQKLFVHLPVMNKYSESEAPESFDELGEQPMLESGIGGGVGHFILNLIGENPYENIMDGVESVEYVEQTELDGDSVHRLKFAQDEFDWEAWIDAGEKPLLRRIAFDLSKVMSQQAVPGMPEMQMSVAQDFLNWKLDEPLGDDAFVFVAPEGAEKTDDLFGMAGESEEELSPLLGQHAPAVELDLLDGGKFSLAALKGKKIVVLDFWATWCGPCVAALPLLAEIVGEYASEGVVLYAVNQGEKADEIRSFLEAEDLDVTVALDSDGSTGDRYGVQGIPTTVIIDKGGTVQSVHVGFDPQIMSVLSREFDDLLAGKNLAEQTIKEHEEKLVRQAANAPSPEGLKLVWSQQGSYTGVAVDNAKPAIYALRLSGECDVYNSGGEKQRTFRIPGRATTLRPARLAQGEDITLLAFRHWGHDVGAFQVDGTPLWTEPNDVGVDDVWAADLDGDGLDEVIIGYNGSGGLHVLGRDGAPRWKQTDIGNVWHVCAGDVTGDAAVEVVSTSAHGSVHIFSAQGEVHDTLSAPVYAAMVRVGRVQPNDKTATIFAAGTSDGENESLIAMNDDGEILFRVDFPSGSGNVDSLAVCPTRPWLAVGFRGGMIAVVDAAEGRIIAQAFKQGEVTEVTWSAPPSATPLLLTAGRQILNAFEVIPTDAAGPGTNDTEQQSEEPPADE